MAKKIDPELLKQLESTDTLLAADEEEDLVEAVIKVECTEEQQEDDIDSILNSLLTRIEQSEHLSPEDYNTFPLMQRAVIRGKKTFIKKLIEQNEVVSAAANIKSRS